MKKLLKGICGALLLSLSAPSLADQVNPLRFKNAFSYDAYQVEDSLETYKGLGVEYKGYFSFSYEQAQNLINLVESNSNNNILELVDSMQRLRLDAGYMLKPKLFIGATIAADASKAKSPFNPEGGNDSINSTSSKSFNWGLGDVGLMTKYRLTSDLNDWSISALARIEFPTGSVEAFTTDDSIIYSLGLSTTTYLDSSHKHRLYGNIGFMRADNSKINVNKNFSEFDASRRLFVGLGWNYYFADRWSSFLETAMQSSFPLNANNVPTAVNIGFQYEKDDFTYYGGAGLETFFAEENIDHRYYAGIKYGFGSTEKEVVGQKQTRQKYLKSMKGKLYKERLANNPNAAEAVSSSSVLVADNRPRYMELKRLIGYSRMIYFQYESSKIIPIFNQILDDLAIALIDQQETFQHILIHGFSDSKGEKGGNKILSLKRANNIKRYLVNRGVPKNKIKTQGHGAAKPMVDILDEDSHRLNRRIEIELK